MTNQVTQFKEQFEEDVDKRKAQSGEHLAFLKEREKQVNEIFGAIGSASLAGHFKRTADEQDAPPNRYRLIALGLMLGTVAIAVITFYHTLRQAAPDWKLFGFRLATSLVLLIPALYAARESAKHRAREARLRKSHLELASIDAYLILLPEEKRSEIKEKLTEKFFGQAEPVEKDLEMVTGHALLNVIEMAMKNLTSGKSIIEEEMVLEWIKAAGTVFAAISLYLAYRQLRANVRWNRINATFSYLSEPFFLERERGAAAALKGVGIELYEQSTPLAAPAVDAILADSNVFREVKDFLNLFENYAAAHKAGAIDPDHSYILNASQFIRYFEVFEPLIEQVQHRKPMFWVEFERLTPRDWKKRQTGRTATRIRSTRGRPTRAKISLAKHTHLR